MSFLPFLQQFLRFPALTGAIAPSSRRLADAMVLLADLGPTSRIVEFGPGTGVITEAILQHLPGSALFFSIEINPIFIELTQKRCPGVTIYHDSAENAKQYLLAHGTEQCDVILCGLPWAAFSDELHERLLGVIDDILAPGGRFLTFAYLQGLLLPAGYKFRKKLRSRFSCLATSRIVWRNLPPAFIYIAQK